MIIYKQKGNKGFTLVELLIVISIIALLSAVVFTNVQAAKIRAEDTQRLTQAKNIVQAMELYRNDHRGYYPYTDPAFPSERFSGQRLIWWDCNSSSGYSNNTKLSGSGAAPPGNPMQLLVDEGYLHELPKDPDQSGTGLTSCIYNVIGRHIGCHGSQDGSTNLPSDHNNFVSAFYSKTDLGLPYLHYPISSSGGYVRKINDGLGYTEPGITHGTRIIHCTPS